MRLTNNLRSEVRLTTRVYGMCEALLYIMDILACKDIVNCGLGYTVLKSVLWASSEK